MPPRCTGKTKTGKRCKAAPLKGTKRCGAHPLSPGSTRFGSPEQASAAGKRGGRPRAPRPSELMRQRVEDEVETILAPYFDAVRQAVVVAKYEGEVNVSDVPDYGARIHAAEKLLDRAYGRPRQGFDIGTTTDASEPGAPLVSIVGVDATDPEIRRLAHELLAREAGRAPRARSADRKTKSRRLRVDSQRQGPDAK